MKAAIEKFRRSGPPPKRAMIGVQRFPQSLCYGGKTCPLPLSNLALFTGILHRVNAFRGIGPWNQTCRSFQC